MFEFFTVQDEMMKGKHTGFTSFWLNLALLV